MFFSVLTPGGLMQRCSDPTGVPLSRPSTHRLMGCRRNPTGTGDSCYHFKGREWLNRPLYVDHIIIDHISPYLVLWNTGFRYASESIFSPVTILVAALGMLQSVSVQILCQFMSFSQHHWLAVLSATHINNHVTLRSFKTLYNALFHKSSADLEEESRLTIILQEVQSRSQL